MLIFRNFLVKKSKKNFNDAFLNSPNVIFYKWFSNFFKAETFLNVIKCFEEQEEDSDARDDKTISAVGILSTVDSILSVMEGKLEVNIILND